MKALVAAALVILVFAAPRSSVATHGRCCAVASDCGTTAVCSPYTFNVANHCRKVCRDKCKSNADCPPRPGAPSNLFCIDGLCEIPSPGS